MPRDTRPPNELTKAELRERIIRRSLRVFRECEQSIIDGEYWNGLNPQHTPLDLEDFRVCRAQALATLKEFGTCPKSRL